MAIIDFPNSPSEGSTYDFGGVRYTFTLVGGAPGYWRVTEPGLVGPASGQEVTDGTDAFKYATSLAIEESNLMKAWVLQANGGAAAIIGKNTAVNFSSTGSTMNVSRSGQTIQMSVDTGTTSQPGTVQLYNGIGSTSSALAATANAVKLAYDEGAAKCSLKGYSGGSTNQKWTFGGTQAGTNMQVIVGRKTYTERAGLNQAFTFDQSGFSTACVHVVATPRRYISGAGAMTLNLMADPTKTGFTLAGFSHNDFGNNDLAFGYIAFGY